MCLILFAYKYHPQYPMILAANRDEYYNRPSDYAKFWKDNPDILGGRDLKKMGTWMGLTRTGRFAAITNYRDPSWEIENAASRGELVSHYLNSNESADEYVKKLQHKSHHYNGFNLIFGDIHTFMYYSNKTNVIQEVKPGIHGLSNHLLDTPWPKVVNGKHMLEDCLQHSPIQTDCLFNVLADTVKPKDKQLPNTGIGTEQERLLSPIFIKSRDYGTRSSTILMIDIKLNVIYKERFLDIKQNNWQEVSYEFNLSKRN